MITNKTIINDLIFLGVLNVLLVIGLVIFNAYHNSITSTISPSVNKTITQITPNFDMETIENLKKRKLIKITDEELKLTEDGIEIVSASSSAFVDNKNKISTSSSEIKNSSISANLKQQNSSTGSSQI